uniref:CCHC-type domain-containing protein n=1 Tax=Strigamia maritima TaxID=126957 RepID=T1ITT8_STRMM
MSFGHLMPKKPAFRIYPYGLQILDYDSGNDHIRTNENRLDEDAVAEWSEAEVFIAITGSSRAEKANWSDIGISMFKRLFEDFAASYCCLLVRCQLPLFYSGSHTGFSSTKKHGYGFQQVSHFNLMLLCGFLVLLDVLALISRAELFEEFSRPTCEFARPICVSYRSAVSGLSLSPAHGDKQSDAVFKRIQRFIVRIIDWSSFSSDLFGRLRKNSIFGATSRTSSAIDDKNSRTIKPGSHHRSLHLEADTPLVDICSIFVCFVSYRSFFHLRDYLTLRGFLHIPEDLFRIGSDLILEENFWICAWFLILAQRIRSTLLCPATADVVTKFDTDQSKAGGIIFLGIEDKLKCLLDGLTGPVERWEKLGKTFEPKSKTRISRLLGEFHLAQMGENESIILFLNCITQLARDLELAGKKISDADIAYRMTCTLPPQYHNVVSIMYRWEDTEFIPSKVEAMLIEEFENLKARSAHPNNSGVKTGNNGDNALSTDKRKSDRGKSNMGIICYNCGIKGHYSKDCRKKSKKEVTCSICKVLGHYSASCRKGKPNTSGGGGSVSYSVPFDTEALIIDVMSVPSTTNEWIWDTGSETHLCHDKNLFSQLSMGKPYQMNAYSGTFNVEGVGTVEFTHLVNNAQQKIILNNVGYAPTGKRNLISGSRAMEAGCSWSGKKDEILVRNKHEKPILKFTRSKGLFKLVATKCSSNSDILGPKAINGFSQNKVNITEGKPSGDFELWHRRLMHINVDSMVNWGKN